MYEAEPAYTGNKENVIPQCLPASLFFRMFSLGSWGVWFATSAPLFIQAFITSPLLCHLMRGSRTCLLTQAHTCGWGGAVDNLPHWNDLSRCRIRLNYQHMEAQFLSSSSWTDTIPIMKCDGKVSFSHLWWPNPCRNICSQLDAHQIKYINVREHFSCYIHVISIHFSPVFTLANLKFW